MISLYNTMKELDLNIVNAHSDYRVWLSPKGKYVFKTDHDILYAVDFELDSNPYYIAYWFNLANPEHQKSPNDVKIAQTIICIIEEFFRQNPEILLYMCSTDGGQQAQRARLFLRWFNGYEQQQKYFIKTSEVKGEELTEYVALIIQRSHPKLEEIVQRFDEETGMFNELKP